MGKAKAPRPRAPEALKTKTHTEGPDLWITLGEHESHLGEVVPERRWPFRLGEVEPFHVRKLRLSTGLGLQELRILLGDVNWQELDTFSALVWLARMQNGEPHLTLEEVEDGVTFDTHRDIDRGDAFEEDPTSPEA